MKALEPVQSFIHSLPGYFHSAFLYCQQHVLTLAGAGFAFVVWVGVLMVGKHKLFQKFRALAQKASTRIYDVLIESLEFPLALFIFLSGAGLARSILDLDPKIDGFLFLLIKGGFVVTAVLFASKLLDSLLKHYGSAKEMKMLTRGMSRRLVKGVIIVCGLWAIMGMMGFSLTHILGLEGLAVRLVKGGVFLALWLFILMTLKQRVFAMLEKYAQRTNSQVDDMLLESFGLPVTILIVALGLGWALNMADLGPKIYLLSHLLVKGAFVFSAIVFGVGLVDNLLKHFGDRKRVAMLSSGITRGLVKGVIVGLGLLILLDMMGVSITPLLASLGIGSLAVALALQDTLSNFFAGIHLMVDKPLRVGDFVKLEGGQEGTVAEIGWRSTRLRMPSKHMIVLPNSKLTNSVMTNCLLPSKTFAVSVEVGVEYDSNLKRVEKITCEVAKKILQSVSGGVPDFEPVVRYHTFGDYSINFTVVLQAREFGDIGLIKHEFIKALHERYAQEQIVMPSRTHELLLAQTLEGRQRNWKNLREAS